MTTSTKLALCLLFVSISANAAPDIGAVSVKPRVVAINVPTPICVTVGLPDASVMASSVSLVRLADGGKPNQTIAPFRNDGSGGKCYSGDAIYSALVTLNEARAGTIRLQASIAFRGAPTPTLIDLPVLFVQKASAPTDMLKSMAAQLAAGDIAGASAHFANPIDVATRFTGIPAEKRIRFAAAFGKAVPVREPGSGDAKFYTTSLVIEDGTTRTIELMLAPNETGEWIITNW